MMAAFGGDADSGGTRFDASQYAFFGGDSVDEVELGGLDEDEENKSVANFTGIDEERQSSYADTRFEGEGEGLESFSDVDDLASTFSKLNRHVTEPRVAMDSRAIFSRESSVPSDFPQNQLHNQIQNHQMFNSHPLNRNASYPQNIPQNFPTDPIPVPNNLMLRIPHMAPPLNPNLLPQNPNFIPPNNHPSQPGSPNPNFLPQNPNFIPINNPPNPNFIPINNPPNPNFHPIQNTNFHPQNPRPSPPNSNFFPNPNSFHPHMLPPHMFLQQHSPPQQIPLNTRYRPNYTRFDHHHHSSRLCSKYMTIDEIEHISRMQNAMANGPDPYIDDYYHQACLSNKSKDFADPVFKHRFCPTVIRDPSSRNRARDEPHAFLQVEALGRLPFSSIRRPRPLLDVEEKTSSEDLKPVKIKPLDQEPMLAARIMIEDALNLILDIDDIDRVLDFTQVPDNGFPLRRKRQAILEEIAGSLHLVDPLRIGTNTDDFVFLRIVSLPKGRKLLTRYVDVVTGTSNENTELARVVCMAVFRHLRFLFGTAYAETGTSRTLTGTVCTCIRTMDLSSLSACLAAVVCSNEQPPLRPIGSSAGDGASLALKTVLERATELLVRNSASYAPPARALWQASFDAFFGLLTKYCTGKFDSILAQLNSIVGGSEIGGAISREIPVELLRASLPHTNEAQRRVLIDFAQRSLPVSEFKERSSSSNVVASVLS